MANTYLTNPVVSVGASSPGTALTTQAKSATLTKLVEALEDTSFGSTARTYTGGLANHTVSITFYNSYASSSTYATLTALVGTKCFVSLKPVDAAISGTNPEFQLTDCYLESCDLVNGEMGSLSEIEVTFTGGTLVEDTTP